MHLDREQQQPVGRHYGRDWYGHRYGYLQRGAVRRKAEEAKRHDDGGRADSDDPAVEVIASVAGRRGTRSDILSSGPRTAAKRKTISKNEGCWRRHRVRQRSSATTGIISRFGSTLRTRSVVSSVPNPLMDKNFSPTSLLYSFAGFHGRAIQSPFLR